MPRALRRRSREEEPERRDAPAEDPRHILLQLQRTAGNQAVARLLARDFSGGEIVKDRKPIDDLAGKKDVKPADRISAYAKIAGTEAVQMDPAVVHESGLVKDGINLVTLAKADDVPAKTDFVDAEGHATGGAPPESATGVAISVNTKATRFLDEDYMVAAIRHEMVHARLMRLTLKQLAAWKQKPEGLPFPQYVEKKVSSVSDSALVKDRFFGGHMDETVAYAEGFLSAFLLAPVEKPGEGDHAWIAHFEGFAKQLEKARANDRGEVKRAPKVEEPNLATAQSAHAAILEAEKLVKDYCAAGGAARAKNLAAWMVYLNDQGKLYEPALALVYTAATSGKKLAKRKA